MCRHSKQAEVAKGEAGVLLLHRLLAACRLAQASVTAIRKAASQTSAHLARLHFVKMHLVFLAILGRLQVYSCPRWGERVGWISLQFKEGLEVCKE